MKVKSLKTRIIVRIFIPIIFIYIGVMTYQSINYFNKNLQQEHNIADNQSLNYGSRLENQLSENMIYARSLAQTLEGIKELPGRERLEICEDMLHSVRKHNKSYFSIWVYWNYNTINKNWKHEYGIRREIMYAKGDSYEIVRDTMHLDGNEGALYKEIKQENREYATVPYMENFQGLLTEDVLATSVCVPIQDNGKYIGLAGIDLSLDHYQQLIETFERQPRSNMILFAPDGQIVASTDVTQKGKQLQEEASALFEENNVIELLKSNDNFSLTTQVDADKYYNSITPIYIGKDPRPWGIIVSFSNNVIM